MRLLSDENIMLRPVEPGDADVMWEMESDSEQWIHNGMAAPYSLHNLKEYANNYDADPIRSGQLRLIIESTDTKEILGAVDMYDINPLHRRAFVGIYICCEFRKSGYALKALKLLEDYAFKLLNMHQLGAKIISKNKGSIKLFKKLGYNFIATLPDWYKSGNNWQSVHIFIKNLDNVNKP